MLIRIANMEDPDHRSSLVLVYAVCLGHFGSKLVFVYFSTLDL